MFSLMMADTFMSEVLHQGLDARHLTTGVDFAFGHRRGGDAAFLAARAEALGMGVTQVPPLTDSGGPLSSTRIRRALQDGYPSAQLWELGRPWAIRGESHMATSAAAPSGSRLQTSHLAGIWNRHVEFMR